MLVAAAQRVFAPFLASHKKRTSTHSILLPFASKILPDTRLCLLGLDLCSLTGAIRRTLLLPRVLPSRPVSRALASRIAPNPFSWCCTLRYVPFTPALPTQGSNTRANPHLRCLPDSFPPSHPCVSSVCLCTLIFANQYDRVSENHCLSSLSISLEVEKCLLCICDQSRLFTAPDRCDLALHTHTGTHRTIMEQNCTLKYATHITIPHMNTNKSANA